MKAAGGTSALAVYIIDPLSNHPRLWHSQGMPKRSSKPQDLNQLAAEIVSQATGQPVKDPLAVELGRRGGLKGGKARAKKLSKAQRIEIAKKAARARWEGRS